MSPGICVLLGPWMSKMIVAWQAGMFGRYLSIHSGGISLSPSAPQTPMSGPVPSGLRAFTLAGPRSSSSVAPMTEANSIPIRSGVIVPFASPASCIAS